VAPTRRRLLPRARLKSGFRTRSVSLDPATIEVLRAPLKVQQEACATMGVPFRANGYVFTRDGLGDEPWVPDSVTQRFDRMRGQLG